MVRGIARWTLRRVRLGTATVNPGSTSALAIVAPVLAGATFLAGAVFLAGATFLAEATVLAGAVFLAGAAFFEGAEARRVRGREVTVLSAMALTSTSVGVSRPGTHDHIDGRRSASRTDLAANL
jgi:hypothetical protein